MLSGRSLCRVEQAERPRSELHKLRHAPGLDVLMRREQILHGLGADAPLQGTVDVGIEFFRRETRALVEREMQAEQTPCRVLEAIEFLEKCGGQLFAANQSFESLVYVERRGHELPGAHGPSISQFDACRASGFDDNTVDVHLRCKRAAGGYEGFHQAARQIERAALA